MMGKAQLYNIAIILLLYEKITGCMSHRCSCKFLLCTEITGEEERSANHAPRKRLFHEQMAGPR